MQGRDLRDVCFIIVKRPRGFCFVCRFYRYFLPNFSAGQIFWLDLAEFQDIEHPETDAVDENRLAPVEVAVEPVLKGRSRRPQLLEDIVHRLPFSRDVVEKCRIVFGPAAQVGVS